MAKEITITSEEENKIEQFVRFVKGNKTDDAKEFMQDSGNQELIKTKLDTYVGTAFGGHPVHIARPGMLKLLIQWGLNYNYTDGDFYRKNTPLNSAIFAYSHGRDPEIKKEIIKLLLQQPDTDVNLPEQHNRTPLCSAILIKDIEILKMLLEHPKIEINKKGDFGASANALDIAIELNKLEAAQLLLDKGATYNKDKLKDLSEEMKQLLDEYSGVVLKPAKPSNDPQGGEGLPIELEVKKDDEKVAVIGQSDTMEDVTMGTDE